MKALFVFLLVPLSSAVYIALAAGMGIYQRYPIFHYAVALAALLILLRLLLQHFSWWRLGLNVGGWALLAFFAWWTLSYSAYPTTGREAAPGTSVLAEEATASLVDADGHPAPLADLLAGNGKTLFVFYRGHW